MASTRILHRTLFLASHLISAQVLFTPLASSSTVLRHVFFGLPLPRLPWGFHPRVCLVTSSIGFRSVWPSHPHLHFLICKSILGCFVHFHNSLFVIWSGQKILNIFLRLSLIKTCCLVVIYRVSQEEYARLLESVPYVQVYRYNPKYLYPKFNGYGDNSQRSLKL